MTIGIMTTGGFSKILNCPFKHMGIWSRLSTHLCVILYCLLMFYIMFWLVNWGLRVVKIKEEQERAVIGHKLTNMSDHRAPATTPGLRCLAHLYKTLLQPQQQACVMFAEMVLNPFRYCFFMFGGGVWAFFHFLSQGPRASGGMRQWPLTLS